MTEEDLAKQLHDKATRGFALSAAEQAQLEVWYAQQDQAEAATLRQTEQSQGVLQAQVDATITKLLSVSQRIQELTSENASLRQDIAELQRRVTQTSSVQSA